MQPPLDLARVRITELAGRLGVPDERLPWFGAAADNMSFVRVRDGRYEYGFSERGRERVQRTDDLDELAYWALKDIVFSLACRWELDHRVEGQDFRILLFGREMELLDGLDPRWGDRWRAEHADLLREVGLA